MKRTQMWSRLSLMLVAVLMLALVFGLVGCGGCGGATTTDPGNTTVTEGPETGEYYFDAESGEYTVHLHSGNQFTLNDGVAKVGTYTASGNAISFTFAKESNGTATATIDGDVLTLNYNGQQIRFLKKTEYTVSFNANGGEGAPAAVKVVNGRAISAVADPAKAGFAFIGWYTDEALTAPYIFGSTPVTADITLYAKWVEKAVGQVEYTVDFEGADVESMVTVGGKLASVPTPTKDGYTFGGWWISDYENADKLTALYGNDTVFTANTTLFALWIESAGDKLAAPLVSVTADGLSWERVDGAATYAVKITDPNGNVTEENVSEISKAYDFAVAGNYVVEVTAVSTDTAKNSAATVRYYNAKALNRVSVFEVIAPSTLIFNDVGADKYIITVVCGNPDHDHASVNNGTSTVYNFANCTMKEGGIEITVTAVKNGYASSVSGTFTYERKLGKVEGLAVDANENLVWTPVEGAMYYIVEINGATEYVRSASYSMKGYTGDVAVKVTPYTEGYLAETAEYTCKLSAVAAPTGVSVSGNTVTWNAVNGASSYIVKVGAKTFTANGTTLDLSTADIVIANGEAVEISVKAVANGAESVFSDTVIAKKAAFDGNLVYANGNVSWTPVIGNGKFEVKINDGEAVTVNGANSYAVKFDMAGINTVSVRFVGDFTSDWVTEEIMVYAIIFDSRLGSAVESVYVAAGDAVVLPAEVTRPGYIFNGWYNTPNASKGNGALYSAPFYTANDDTVLYADWKADTYKVIYNTDADVQGVTNGDSTDVLFNSEFTLPVPTSDKGSFLGWFTGPDGSGLQVADAYGKSNGAYATVGNTTVYPFFEVGTLTYVEQEDGTWAVTAGPNIRNAANVIIPETYKGAKVTTILENAFSYNQTMVTISIPDTVELIGAGAFTGCYTLESIEVRPIDGSHIPVYSSYDGALIREYLGTTYFELYPIARKEKSYTIPAGVDTIRNKAFHYADNLESLTVSKDVTYIADQAFFHCLALKNITFEQGGANTLEINAEAFFDMRKLETIAFPARLAEMDLAVFDSCPKLAGFTVEAGGSVYGSKDGMLTNGNGDTIIYAPVTLSGDITIPVGVTAIGEGAFANRAGITSVTVSNKVESIGADAFAGCQNIAAVTFVGGRNTNLVIGNGAFENCAGITTVSFASLTRANDVDEGTVTIGDAAFKGCSKLGELNFDASANVVAIGNNAFENCSRLPAIVIPATTTTIGDSAFAGCSGVLSVEFAEGATAGNEIRFGNSVFSGCSLLKSISLPATVTKFDGSVFAGCDSITEIIVAEDNPALFAADGVLYNKAKTEIMYYPTAKEIDFNNLPNTLTTIGDSAFQNNFKVTAVTIPAGITSIGANAFDGCVNLESVTFEGNGNVAINAYAFANCRKLASIELPAAVTAIGDRAFYMTGLTEITIPAAVETIGAYAFASTNLASLTIPANVTKIGDGAFSGIATLKSVTVEDGEKALELGSLSDAKGVFSGSNSIASATLNRVSIIGAKAFQFVSGLATVTIPDTAPLTHIGDNAFQAAYQIKAINLPNGLQRLGSYSLANTGITSITIPNTVEYIGDYGLMISALTEVTFAPGGDAKLAIANDVFNGCNSLKTITFPKRLDSIGSTTMAGSIEIPTVYMVFNWNNGISEIKVEEGCAKYSAYDGILYENDANGDPSVLLFCPTGRTGEVTIPSTVVEVVYHAFYNAQVSKITFAEKENWDGVSTLVIGDFLGSDWSLQSHSIFQSSFITEINLPAHLKQIGTYAFANWSNYSGIDIKVNFNPNTNPIAIGSYAFYYTTLSTLELPKVGSMSANAINSNRNLTKLTFGKGSTLTAIESYGLAQNSMITEIEIPASVTTIGDYAFQSCGNLKTLTFESGSKLKNIGNYAFQSLPITSFTFPEGIETIGNGVFAYCNSLTEVTLASNMSSIYSVTGGNIFENANALKTVNVPGDSTKLKVVDGVLYNYDQTVLMLVPAGADYTGKTFTVPATVTSIEVRAFANFNGDAVVLPAGLVKIGNYAFSNARNIKTLTIPASVKEIGSYGLSDMMSLTAITFDGVSELETIGGDAFFYNVSLKAIVLPDSVKTLGAQAFRNNESLESVVLPSGLKVLGNNTFEQCKLLKNITLPEGLETIETAAFYKCVSLESITIPASVEEITNAGWQGVFQDCAALTEVKFADGSKITSLGAYAFKNATALKEIVLPESMIEFSKEMFVGCTGLESVTFLGDINAVPASAFSTCTNLKKVVLNDNISEIRNNAFDGCANLEEINLPAELTTIGTAAFRGCAKLTTVNVGAKVESIGNYAFDGCAALASVTFDENCEIASLGDDPAVESAIFRGTAALKSITLPETVTSFGAYLFANSGLETVTVPAGITAISDYCFAGCANLTEVSVPESVKSIGNYAFADCSGIKDINIAFGVESIGAAAFLDCVELESINIPATIATLEGNPFVNCPKLADLGFDEGNTDFVFKDGALFNSSETTLIYYLPGNTAEVYEIPEGVRELAAGAFYGSQIKSIEIPEGIKSIPDMLFMDSKKLETVIIPASVTYVGKQAFSGCSAIKSFEMSDLITYVGEYAFANCESLESFTFAERKTDYTIGAHAFEGCTALTAMEFAPGLTGLPAYVFANTGIVEITVPASVGSVNVEGVFANCAKLETVVFENGITGTLGEKFFYNCTALKSVTLSTGIDALGTLDYKGTDYDMNGVIDPAWGEVEYFDTASESYAFYGCTALESIDLSNVKIIGSYAFYGCTSLKDVTFGMEMAIIGNYAFAECTGLESVDMSTVIMALSYYNGASFWINFDIGEGAFKNCSSITELILPENCVGLIKDACFEGCSSLKRIEIIELYMGFEGSPFKGWTSDQVVYFDWYAAEEIYGYFYEWQISMIAYYPQYANYILWLNDTDATFLGYDGGILLDAEGNVQLPEAEG